MGEEFVITIVCPNCGGSHIRYHSSGAQNAEGENLPPNGFDCEVCREDGTVVVGTVTIPQLDDILNKVNDVKQKVDEIKNIVDELYEEVN